VFGQLLADSDDNVSDEDDVNDQDQDKEQEHRFEITKKDA
jgi:hypothetical protein